MKNLLCLLLMTFFSVTAFTQKVHFIYFETDNSQPFYLKFEDKVYSSSSTGGFILPNLSIGTYSVSVGFPATSAEGKFLLSVTDKDYGYSIKSFDFGLGLFDLQALSVIKPQANEWKAGVSYQYRN